MEICPKEAERYQFHCTIVVQVMRYLKGKKVIVSKVLNLKEQQVNNLKN